MFENDSIFITWLRSQKISDGGVLGKNIQLLSIMEQTILA